MKKAILLCLVVGSISACSTVQPAKSDCFRNGRAVCKFTPLAEVWAQDAPATQAQGGAL